MPGQPPNPPLGSLDLYKCQIPPSPDSLSPDLAPLGKRTIPRTEESQIDIGPTSQDPHRVATDDRGPFDSFDEVCAQTQGPPVTRTGYADLSRRDLHDLWKQRGYAWQDSKASLCTRLRKMDEVDSARGLSLMRGRTQKAMAESCEPAIEEQRSYKRRRRAYAHLNFATNKEISKHHAQWRNKEMQLFWNTPSNL